MAVSLSACLTSYSEQSPSASSGPAWNSSPYALGDPPFDVYANYLGDKGPASAFYAITASGTATLRVTELVI